MLCSHVFKRLDLAIAPVGFIALTFSLLSGPVRAGNYMYYPNTVLYLGATFDPTDLSRAFPSCIEFDREISLDRSKDGTSFVGSDHVANTFGSETNFDINQVQSQRDLYHYLNISASISGHYSFFSGGGSFELEQEDANHEDSFSWIVRASTDYGRFGMEHPRLTAEAKEALKEGLDHFRYRCGYEYIAQVNRTVIAAAVYTIRNVSASNKRSLEASFNAEVGTGVWGVAGNESYRDFIKQAASLGVMELKIYLVGGGGITKISDVAQDTWNIDSLKLKLIRYLKDMDSSKAVPTQYISGSLSAFATDMANIDFNQYIQTIDNLYFIRNEYLYRASVLRKVLLNSEDYGWSNSDWASWKSVYDHIDTKIQNVNNTARDCRREYSTVIAAATPSKSTHPPSSHAHGAPPIHTNELAAADADASAQRTSLELISRGVQDSAAKEPLKALDVVQASSSKITDACSFRNTLLDYADSKLPPPYPFSLDYYVTSNVDANDKEIYNLVAAVSGPSVLRAQVIDAQDHTVQIWSAVDASGKAAGSVDISDFRTTNRLPVKIRVEVQSGRTYDVMIPFL